MPELTPELRKRCVTTIRMLSIDGVEKAQSGHPGSPLGQAPMAFTLWSKFMRFNPDHPDCPNRDRFVLSAGHGSMLVYSLLHLFGFDLSIEELKNFRQWGSKTPGHPEHGHTPGVETTTGPLGQGFSNGVGMALAQKMMNARFSREEGALLDHRVYGIVSDGDLMEGISAESAALAGHLGLGNLIYLYDDNQITIDGKTDLAFSEDMRKRFEGHGWQVLRVADGEDFDAIENAVREGIEETSRPTLVMVRTVIGHGSPGKAGTPEVHGAPLGSGEWEATREAYDWTEPEFTVPKDVRQWFDAAVGEKKKEIRAWEETLARWKEENPQAAELWEAYWEKKIPVGLEEDLLKAFEEGKADATRSHSGKVIQAAARRLPYLVGGSADLASSNKTDIKDGGSVMPRKPGDPASTNYAGRNLHFGIREHAMGGIVNGIAQYGSFIPFGATFMVFSDYMRTPIRLSSLMNLRSIWVFTHDSIFLGEDGPTHQPVEHLTALREIPGMTLFRPADGLETAMSWGWALRHGRGPTCLVFTRQKLPAVDRPAGFDPKEVWRGGYVVVPEKEPDIILVGTGSELHLATGAREKLVEAGYKVRVVSMPSVEQFERQEPVYREGILPSDHPRVCVIEAGRTRFWRSYAGRRGLVIGIDSFGASAPAEVLAEKFGFTVERVTEKILKWASATPASKAHCESV